MSYLTVIRSHDRKVAINYYYIMLRLLLDEKAASPLHMDGSVMFARIANIHPNLIHASLDQPESTSQTACGSVQPFLHSSRQTVHILYKGPPPSQNCPFAWGSGPPSRPNTWFLGPTRVQNPNGISIGSAVFAGSRSWTDHATLSVT